MKRSSLILILLTVCLVLTQLPCSAGSATASHPVPGYDLGTELVTWEDVWSYRKSNSGKDLVITEQTDSKGLFGRFLRAQTVSLGGNYKDRQFQFWDDNALYGLSGNAKPGDTVLLHIICRSATSGTTAKMHPALYLAGELTTDATKSTLFPEVTVPDTWTEYYFPSTVGTSEPNRLILFLGRSLQSLDIAHMELTNCGDTPSEQLPSGSIDLTADRNPGRRVIWWYSMLQRKSTNTTLVKTTEVTKAEGLFSRYLTVNTTTVDGNYKNRQFQYFDEGSTRGFTGNLWAGETALLHIICRSSAAGTTASFQPAIWKSGDTSTDAVKSFVFDEYTVTDRWTEYWLPVKGGTSAPNRFAMFIGRKVQSMDIAMLELYACGNMEVSALPNSITDLEQDHNVGTVVDLFAGFSGKEHSTGYPDFPTAKVLTAQSYALSAEQTALLSGNTKTVVVSFIVKAPEACTQVEITIKGNKTVRQTYPVPVQWTRIDMPVKLSRLDEISLDFEGELHLAAASYDYQGMQTLKNLSLRSGMHLLEEFVDIPIADTGSTLVGVTMDLVRSGDRIYSIGNGSLTITDVSDVNAPKVLGRLGNMGSAIRQITLLGDGKHVFISSRQNGCYIVNVEDPANPLLVSRYDSVEMATGVDAYGDYVYVCDRQYGVEIVDVSDVYHPVQCAIVRGGTAQSCKVVDGILYMGSWNERSVDIYDVRQPSGPVYLGSAPLSGKGDGMTVLTVNGRTYLYAATGQHGLGVSENITATVTEEDILANLNFGQGNGLDIFDVTDPANPVWLSSSRIDGRYYFPNNDYWEVEVAEEKGRLYAYVLNTYNGVYILDVTDPSAPVRVAHSYVTSDAIGIQSYSSRGIIFPYDQSVQRQSPVAAIAVEDGVLYMASSMTDLHICNDQALQPYLFAAEEKSQAVAIEQPTGDFYELDGAATGLTGFAQYQSVGQTYAAVVYNELIYAACGKEGIVVLDEELNKLATITTQDIAMDVQIYEGRMFCAESAGGLACYILSDDGLSATEQWRYTSSKGVIRQVRLSPKARWAIIQCGSVNGEIVSTDAPTAPVLSCSAASQMYHHTVLHTLAGGRYTGIWAEHGYVFWYDFGENDDYDVPVLVGKWTANSAAINNGSMTGGVPGYPGYVLCTKNIADGSPGGYVLYDPTAATNTAMLNAKDADTPFSGKPAIAGNLLITGERINGRICIVDISNLADPNVLKTVSVTGNPDIPYVHGNYVLIPMGYQGLVKFDLAPWNGQLASVGEERYTSVAAAISACDADKYVTLLGNVTEDLYVQKNLYLDLNGKTLTGNITVSEGARLYVFDSATADYTAQNRGRILGSITGELVRSFNTPASCGYNYKYLALEESDNVWSFHRYYLSVASAVLHPMYNGSTTLNYKTVFKTNALLAGYVTGYGAKLTGDTTVYADGVANGFVLSSGAAQRNELVTALAGTLKTANSQEVNGVNATAIVRVCAFLQLKDGTQITSAQVSCSLKDVVIAVNESTVLTDGQKSALGRMYQTFRSIFDAWTDADLSNIKSYISYI